MQCSVCRKPATHVCSQCKRRTYCSAKCQRQDWFTNYGVHSLICTPFFDLIAGKRSRDEEAEIEKQAASEFVRRFSA